MKLFLTLILAFLNLLYIPLNRQNPKYSFISRLDSHIPLLPWSVWIYASYYIFLPLAIFMCWHTPVIIPLLITLILSSAFASLFWKIFPNGVSRPTISPNSSVHHRLLYSIYYYDRDCNGLPSGHVMHTLIVSYFLSLAYPGTWITMYVITLLISFSTLTTKQHYYLDMVITLSVTPLLIDLSSLITTLPLFWV